jgi:hypothetical protein
MAISQQQLAAIIGGKARQLCSPENEKLIEGYTSRGKVTDLNNPDPSEYDSDAAEFDRMYLSSTDNVEREPYHNNAPTNSRMPEFIKQSMLEHHIDTSSLGNTSVLDTLNIKPQRRNVQKRTVMSEQTNAAQNSTIDYNIIKAIVNECLNEYFSKQPLNESATLKTIGLSNGNISIVDNKGNVYKAKLEKIGNKTRNGS